MWACTNTWNHHTYYVYAMVFSPNGEMLATGGNDMKTNVYSVVNGFSRMHTMEGHARINSLSFSPDNTRLVSAGGDKSIRLWNPTEGTLLETVYNAHTNMINAIAHSPNGDLLASGSYDGTINIWDAKTLNNKFAIDDAHSGPVKDLSFSPTEPFLLSTSHDKTVKVIKIALLDSYRWRSPVLLAYLRFSDAVHSSEEVEEVKKFEKAHSAYATKFAGGLLQCALIGGGPKGVLGAILGYL